MEGLSIVVPVPVRRVVAQLALTVLAALVVLAVTPAIARAEEAPPPTVTVTPPAPPPAPPPDPAPAPAPKPAPKRSAPAPRAAPPQPARTTSAPAPAPAPVDPAPEYQAPAPATRAQTRPTPAAPRRTPQKPKRARAKPKPVVRIAPKPVRLEDDRFASLPFRLGAEGVPVAAALGGLAPVAARSETAAGATGDDRLWILAAALVATGAALGAALLLPLGRRLVTGRPPPRPSVDPRGAARHSLTRVTPEIAIWSTTFVVAVALAYVLTLAT